MPENKSYVIGIIGGQGEMGGLFVKLLKAQGYRVLISDKTTQLTNQELVQKSGVIIISVPIDVTVSVIKNIIPFTRADQLLIDLTSIKQPAVKALLKSKAAVIGLHPMFNDSSYGSGQNIIICPARPKNWLAWLKEFLSKAELQMEEMTAKDHDRLMSVIQGLVHFAELGFGKTLKDLGVKVEKLLPFSSPAYQLKISMVGRIFAQEADLYGSIQIKNPFNKKIIKAYLKAHQKLAKIIFKQDLLKFNKEFEKVKKHLGQYPAQAMKDSDWIIAQVLEKNRRLQNKSGLKIPSQIVKSGLDLNKKNKLAVLGPAFSYTDIVSQKFMKSAKILNNEKIYAPGISQVFSLVEKGLVDYGLVPIENSLNGTVGETFDNLFNHDLKIIQELTLPIDHCLAVYPTTAKKYITTIMSHPQAINQCREYLQKHYPGIDLVEAPSTSAAMQMISQKKEACLAVIGPVVAAKAYKLKILAKNIQSKKDTTTHFIVITKKKHQVNKVDSSTALRSARNDTNSIKTSIAFYFGQNRPGILAEVFNDFAKADINLTRIESRPSKKEFGDYIFYLDFVGKESDPKIKKLLQALKEKLAKLKILGTY